MNIHHFLLASHMLANGIHNTIFLEIPENSVRLCHLPLTTLFKCNYKNIRSISLKKAFFLQDLESIYYTHLFLHSHRRYNLQGSSIRESTIYLLTINALLGFTKGGNF